MISKDVNVEECKDQISPFFGLRAICNNSLSLESSDFLLFLSASDRGFLSKNGLIYKNKYIRENISSYQKYFRILMLLAPHKPYLHVGHYYSTHQVFWNTGPEIKVQPKKRNEM